MNGILAKFISSLQSIFSFVEAQSHKRPQHAVFPFLRAFRKPARALSKKSYPVSYYNPTPSAYPSYYPYSYPYPASSPYPTSFDGNDVATNEGIYAGHPASQTGQYHCSSYPGTPGMNRSETFEIKGKSKLTLCNRAFSLVTSPGSLSYLITSTKTTH